MTTLPDLAPWLQIEPYSMDARHKQQALAGALRELTQWHRERCPEYERMLRLLGDHGAGARTIEGIPYLPARVFKEFDLLSVPREQVFKTMTSSGTSGQQVAHIYLDRDTAAVQGKVLARLMAQRMGVRRRPMLIIDSAAVLRNRQAFSARAAAILGFSMFGSDVTYALDEAMQPDWPAIEGFVSRHADEPVLVFGFTFIVWQHFYLALKSQGRRLALDQGMLLHGGGWKKLQDDAVDPSAFRAAMHECAGLAQVVNYYGMVEQTGAIHLECEHGHLHAPVHADVIVRSPSDFRPLGVGEDGLIEVVSLLPRSYPGQALLTEDVGRIEGVDDCPCGRLGRYFSVAGRVARAEVRGCSDTYEQPV